MPASTSSLVPRAPVAVGENRVRHLHDGTAAFPAMLAAIAGANEEILLEMYWIGADRIGELFRAALLERSVAGVHVRILFDAIGSLATPDSFWKPLVDAGAEVQEFSPISPFKSRFRIERLVHRDHRKMLVVDGEVAFTGGINIGELWAPPDSPELAWRDDGIEIRGPAAKELRAAFYDVWARVGRSAPADASDLARSVEHSAVHVLTNRIEHGPNRTIRRAYLSRVRHTTKSIDIASAYFLPGTRFLHALRAAARRGVRVRVLVPEHSDILIVALAMSSLYGRLLADGAEVFAYLPRVLHAKTAIFDERFTMIGSHNLDALSWRFNLECNVIVDSPEFAGVVHASFERDLRDAKKLDLDEWRRRPRWLRLLAWLAALFRTFL